MTSMFIVGASGYTGKALVKAAAAHAKVVAHVRPGSSQLAGMRTLASGCGAIVDTSEWSAPAMASALAAHEPQFVFACLGTTRRRAAKEVGASYETVDYGLTKLLLDACLTLATPPRFVYLSAVGADRPSRNPYMAVRYRFESELKASELRWSIVRPSFIAGDREETRPLERVGAVMADGLLAAASVLGARTLRQRYASLTGHQLAAAMLNLAEADEAAGRNAAHEGQALRAALP